MASPDFPNNLITNTYILNDYLEIAYIVCTGALTAGTDRSANTSDINSRDRVLENLSNARQQFRQASILVVLDAEALELITFYKKADIVKDQQAILNKFTNICRINLCKIERKNACRVIDLVKPELARTWRLFSEAVLSSLTLQTPAGKKVSNINTNIYLIPEFEATLKDGCVQAHSDTKYYLRKADLQIVMPGHLLLALRDSSWPPLYALTDIIDADLLSWRLPLDSVLYLVPTGQLARYKGGWIGKSSSTNIRTQQHPSHDGDNVKYRLRWFEKVRQWLGARHYQNIQPSQETVWCSIEIPVHENVQNQKTDRETLIWKTVIWPAELLFVFQKESGMILQDGNEDIESDPLTTAQAWFVKDLGDIRAAAAAAAAASKDLLQPNIEASLTDGNLFDDDTQFGSPQQFMSMPAQNFHPSHMVYPTPPEAMNPHNTPGISLDGAAQTPMSYQPIQPSTFQSSPLAMTNDPETNRTHESAISSFLQHNDDDLFEDEEDQKLAQPSFGDEPNWDFFDRDTTTLDMKPGLNFEELGASPLPDKSPDLEQDARPKLAQPQPATQENLDQKILDKELTPVALMSQTKEQHSTESINVDVTEAKTLDVAKTILSDVKDFAHRRVSDSRMESISQGNKRRRSSAYDVTPPPQVGYDHKYGPSGKYHFELRRVSVATKDEPNPGQLNRRSSSSSLSSRSSMSQATSDEEENSSDGQLKSWTRYEPGHADETQESYIDDAFDDPTHDAEIDELLEVIATASGSEPFIGVLGPSKQDYDRKVGVRKSPERWLMIAQILTEQLTQSSVFRSYEELQLPRTKSSPAFDIFIESVEIGTNVSNASLGDLASIQPNSNSVKLGTHTLVLEPNRIRLRQGDSEISAELPIIKYWDTLNLQPLNGPKNVQAMCLHPGGSNYLQGCESFLRRMEETYTSCNLGTHQRLKSKGLTESGLLTWDHVSGKHSLTSLCRSVGKALASKNTKGCTIVYVTLPSDDLFESIEICDAFLELFETLGQVDHAPENDIVLQLVPSSFVIGASNVVVRPQKHFIDLAIEVYNRTPSLKSSSASAIAGAIALEKTVSRSLHFELNSKASSPSLGAGHCYHVAYCVSTDHKWLVASWSDAIGNTALTMPYRLLDEENGNRYPRKDVLRHVCETSLHLMSRQKGQSWLTVAKVGIFEPEEMKEWAEFGHQLISEHKFISRFVMVNVELQSRLTLHGPQAPSKLTIPMSQPMVNTLSTPVTTPQAMITSPDQTVAPTGTTTMAANAQTPPDLSTDAGGEVDAYLSDPLNEAWAITFGFGLNQTRNPLEIRPAMASGLLLKKVTRHDNGGGLAILNVNLIAVLRKGHAGVSYSEREQILQDVLVQYRGLHVLGIVRRCVDETEGCIPWHVASAFKGAKLLERLM